MQLVKESLAEAVGTFILVLIGCGSVALAVLFGTFQTLLEVALVWGAGVTLAIFATRKWCPAHLNPAVSVAFFLKGDLPLKKLPFYLFAQTIGAFIAAACLYFFIQSDLNGYELSNGLVRGETGSHFSAVMFGEFFPNPGYAELSVSVYLACTMEMLGTFLLVFSIFKLVQTKRLSSNLVPFLIGLTVTLIICFVAPYTQAGLNPARDFGPRLFASIAGWGQAAFPAVSFSFFTVYILSPILGGVLAFLVNKLTTGKTKE